MIFFRLVLKLRVSAVTINKTFWSTQRHIITLAQRVGSRWIGLLQPERAGKGCLLKPGSLSSCFFFSPYRSGKPNDDEDCLWVKWLPSYSWTGLSCVSVCVCCLYLHLMGAWYYGAWPHIRMTGWHILFAQFFLHLFTSTRWKCVMIPQTSVYLLD